MSEPTGGGPGEEEKSAGVSPDEPPTRPHEAIEPAEEDWEDEEEAPLLAPRSSRRAGFVGAFIVAVGVFVAATFTAGNTFLEGLAYMSYLGIVAMPVVFAIALFVLRSLDRGIRSVRGGDAGPWGARAMVAVAVLCSAGLVAFGYSASRPISRFESLVLSPPPASLAGLRVHKTSTVGGGNGWFFAFEVSPQDFEMIREHQHLSPGDATFTATPPPDEVLRQYGAGLYARPADPRLFVANRLVVVTDAAHTHVFMFFDQFEHGH